MGSSSDIEWTDATWNPTAGCSRVSPGCDNCYAMRFAHRFSGPGGRYEGLTRIGKRGVDWSGVVRLVPAQLDLPLRWKKPRRVFVNSMSDLFHPALSNEEIAAVFGVMAASPRHTFQILTKRPERALEWFRWLDAQAGEHDPPRAVQCGIHAANYGADVDYLGLQDIWPLPNAWLGTSVENQDLADDRISMLLDCQAAIRFISAEPLLGPLDLFAFLKAPLRDKCLGILGSAAPGLDWVIVGGESGSGARPFNVAWARSIAEQCKALGVACFVKQLGAKPYAKCEDCTCAGDEVRYATRWTHANGCGSAMQLEDRKGGDWLEWPEDLRVRQFPEVRI